MSKNRKTLPIDTAEREALRISAGRWDWLQGTGVEDFQLLQSAGTWILRGEISTAGSGGPIQASYQIVCDRSWQTRHANISVHDQSGTRRLLIRADNGRWSVGDRVEDALSRCVDIDLGWTPFTNTLPIRRLNLEIGQGSGPVTAAWITFPDLKIQPLSQEYLRLSRNEYRYSSRGGEFVANISVDDDGIVIEYQDFWRRSDS